MKYISIDIETTGLDPKKHQILEFAAVYDDLKNPCPLAELPTFSRRIYWDDLVINNYCTKLHHGLLMDIVDDWGTKLGRDITTIDQLAGHFVAWANSLKLAPRDSSAACKSYNVAGKNFAGFDGQFLKRVPGFPPWNYRVIDVGSMYLTPDMSELPSLSDIVGNRVSHRALPDALDVVRAIREKLLPQEPVPEVDQDYDADDDHHFNTSWQNH